MLAHQFVEPTKPTRVVLLGAGGFLAPAVRRVLEAEAIPVLALGSRQLDLSSPDARQELAVAMRSGDAIVMAAALTPEKGRDIATMMKNLRMAESVCTAIKELIPAHFIYISSDSVYDGRVASPINESSTCEPTDLYSLMHVARERMLSQTCREGGIPLVVLRPCAIYGPGDTHNSYGPNRFIRTACASGKIALFGGGEETRHHVYVDDVARMVHLCLIHRSTGVLNAVTGKGITFRALTDLIRMELGREVAVECSPRMGPVTHRHLDLTALAKSFPDFRTTPIKEGIARTVRAAAGAS